MDARKKVLIVDDERNIGKMTEMALSFAGGYSTLYCESAASALSKIQYEFIPDLVITDLQMPVMDGLELAKILKEKIPNLPIIILTGRPDLVPRDSPADMVIGKPYFMADFLEKVKQLI